MPSYLKYICAVAFSVLYMFCAEASERVPRRELLCASMLTSSQFANPNENRTTEVTTGGDLNPSDYEERQLALGLEKWSSGGLEVNAFEFWRVIEGTQNVARFMDLMRQNANQSETDLQATGDLSSKFWTGQRIRDFATASVLPSMVAGMTIAGGYHELTLSSADLMSSSQFLVGISLGLNALLANMLRNHFVAAGRYFWSIFSQNWRTRIQNGDANRAHLTDEFWRTMLASPPEGFLKGPSLVLQFPLDLANLLLDPPTKDASEKEVINFNELLRKALAASVDKEVDFSETGLRVLLFRFYAHQDQNLMIRVTVYTPSFLPQRPGHDDPNSRVQLVPGAQPALSGR